MKRGWTVLLSCVLIIGLTNSLALGKRAANLTAASTELYTPAISALIINKASQKENVQADGHSYNPAISQDGRFVAFESQASNLVAGDTNNAGDIFVKDYQDGSVVRVSVTSSGLQASTGGADPDISGDGRFVAFTSYSGDLVSTGNGIGPNVYLHDRDSDSDGIFDEPGAIETIRISEHIQDQYGERGNSQPVISADGCVIAFQSDVINFMPDNNGTFDIYVYDCHTQSIIRASETENHQEGNSNSELPAISADGKWVAFVSAASNLTPLTPDTNGYPDVFIKELATGYVELVSVSSDNQQGNLYSSDSVSPPALSADGNFVAFVSMATNFYPGVVSFYHVYVRNRATRQTSFINHTFDYRPNLSGAQFPDISGDGRWVVFYSGDPNMVPGGDNSWGDIYLQAWKPNPAGIGEMFEASDNQRVSVSVFGKEGNFFSDRPVISQDGRYIAFLSQATDLVAEDTNQRDDIFVRGCHLSGTPIYLQGYPSTRDSVPNNRPEWYDDPYGNNLAGDTYNTMGRWGCNTVCNAMMVNYASFRSGVSFRTDPGLLNQWMRSFSGYDKDNYVRYDRVSNFVEDQTNHSAGLSYVYDATPSESINRKIEDQICLGQPVMLHVSGQTSDGHFVLAIGVATVKGEKTFIIHDPMWGATTLMEKYNNQYSIAKFFRTAQVSAFHISVHSPVHIIVTDPQNRKTGYDPRNNTEWHEIPGAYYGEEWITGPDGVSLPRVKIFSQPDPLKGSYSLQIIGYESGDYIIQADYTTKDSDTTIKQFTGTALPGSVDTVTFLGEGYTLFIPLAMRP